MERENARRVKAGGPWARSADDIYAAAAATGGTSLRVAGASFSAMAGVLAVSKHQAFRDVRAALVETLDQRDADAASYRALELLRCDEMTVALWPAVRRGDAEALPGAVSRIERPDRAVADRAVRLLPAAVTPRRRTLRPGFIDYV